ncbi:MAG: acylphosphatase [Devosia sp.]|nr:acylphosphatase [Devosia sp.]
MNARAIHVSITGLVQGVGYRAWVEREALSRGLAGWVRNRRDGSVEAVFAGESGTVEAMLAACRHGPRTAEVHAVEATETNEPAGRGFQVLPTA